jgi:hypothetical protein
MPECAAPADVLDVDVLDVDVLDGDVRDVVPELGTGHAAALALALAGAAARRTVSGWGRADVDRAVERSGELATAAAERRLEPTSAEVPGLTSKRVAPLELTPPLDIG